MSTGLEDLQIDDDGGGGPSSSPRVRIVAGVVAAMLVAVAGGVGYGLGRSIGDRSNSTDAGSGAAPADAVPANTEAPPAPQTTLADAVAPERAVAEDVGGDVSASGMDASGGSGYAAFGSQPQETLFELTTDDGFVVRAQLGEVWGNNELMFDVPFGPNGWRPAPWCSPSGQLRVALSGNGVIDVGGTPWYSEPFEGRAVSWMLLGGSDANPQWVVVVQAPGDTTQVRVAFANGTSVAATPQNGLAVLVAPGEAPTEVSDGDYSYWVDPTPLFTVSFEGGTDPATIDASGVGQWDNPEFRASCEPPPPALPEAGEQPTDAVAAEAEVRATMTSLYGAIGAEETRDDLLDDPTGVAAAREQVATGGYASSAATAVATIDELVFTAPDEAWFRYSIDTDGNDFSNRYGIAVLIDGMWKITRSTVCQDLSLAGGDCGTGWDQIQPPGAWSSSGEAVPATTYPIGD